MYYLIICYRVWRFGIMASLLLLSLARLYIYISPYSFHARDHFFLSLVCFVGIPAVPIIEKIVSIYKHGHSCDATADFAVKALYGQEIGVQVTNWQSNNVRDLLNLLVFTLNTGLFLHKYFKARHAVAPIPNLFHVQAGFMIRLALVGRCSNWNLYMSNCKNIENLCYFYMYTSFFYSTYNYFD